MRKLFLGFKWTESLQQTIPPPPELGLSWRKDIFPLFLFADLSPQPPSNVLPQKLCGVLADFWAAAERLGWFFKQMVTCWVSSLSLSEKLYSKNRHARVEDLMLISPIHPVQPKDMEKTQLCPRIKYMACWFGPVNRIFVFSTKGCSVRRKNA